MSAAKKTSTILIIATILAVWNLVPSSAASAATPGMALWRDSQNARLEYSPWDGTDFGSIDNAANVGGWRIIAGAEAPTRVEIVALGVDSTRVITGQIWDGSTWSALPFNPLATVSDSYWWGFEVAYETVSGDALIVWNNGTDLSSRTWDGSNWSGELSPALPFSGEPDQMHLASDPYSDEMVLVISNDNTRDYALVWNGWTWGNAISLSNAGTGDDQTDVHVAYEQLSGRAIVTYGRRDTACFYRIWDGSTWSDEASISSAGGSSGDVRWTTLGAEAGSDRIALGVLTHDSDIWLSIWDGSAWGWKQVATNSAGAENCPNLAVAFESGSGEALAVYGESSATLRHRTWDDASGWSGEMDVANLGAEPNSMILDSDPNADQIMLSVQDADSDLHYILWDGSGWGADNELELFTADYKNQKFIFLWDQVSAGWTIGGKVFEDVNFAGIATDWDGGINDVALANVDAELYDSSDNCISTVNASVQGNFLFSGLPDGLYKVRIRSATIGDPDTPPAASFNATVPATWPYPLPELTWGHGSALIGGHDPNVDDTATGDNAGPGDTYVTVTVSGVDVAGVNFGFSYELIVNEDDDASADNVRSKQGTLRQFIKNSNAITGVNKSWFQISGP